MKKSVIREKIIGLLKENNNGLGVYEIAKKLHREKPDYIRLMTTQHLVRYHLRRLLDIKKIKIQIEKTNFGDKEVEKKIYIWIDSSQA